MKIAELPPITRDDDLFAMRTLVCQGCGATFQTANPKTGQRCATCNATVKVKVICPACQAEHQIMISAPHRLCLCCIADLEITKGALQISLEQAEERASEAFVRLDADLAHADEIDRARYELLLESCALGVWKGEQRDADYFGRLIASAIARGDGLSPLLQARQAFDDAAATFDRVRHTVELALEEIELYQDAASATLERARANIERIDQ